LLGNTLLRERPGQTALLQTGQLLLGSTGDTRDEIKPILQLLLKQQRNLHDPRDPGLGPPQLPPAGKKPGMHQILEPLERHVVVKNLGGNVGAVNGAIGGHRLGTKSVAQGKHDLRLHEDVVAHEGIRVEASETALREQPGGSGFAAPESSSKSQNHSSLVRGFGSEIGLAGAFRKSFIARASHAGFCHNLTPPVARMTTIDTKSAPSVAAAVNKLYQEMFQRALPPWIETLFRDVDRAYTGQHPDYQACDLHYHDLEHTLQVTLCFSRLMAGRCKAGVQPVVAPRQFELGLAGALLHDIGYLKLLSDHSGTGAKYTYTHVMRSCAFAAGYLPTQGVTLSELEGVLGGIKCTGTSMEVARMYFHDPVERLIGYAIATSDYLAQMAAPDYPDELEILFREFDESEDYVHLPAANRPFKSAHQLQENTPDFWKQVVMPKLDKHFDSMYRFLADPFPDGPNPYLEAIERNIAEVKRRLENTPKDS
jgi:hypothetical protein